MILYIFSKDYLNIFHRIAEAASFGVVQTLTAYAYVRTIDFFHVVERPNLPILWIQGSAVASETYTTTRQCSFYGLFIATDCEDGCTRKLLMQK